MSGCYHYSADGTCPLFHIAPAFQAEISRFVVKCVPVSTKRRPKEEGKQNVIFRIEIFHYSLTLPKLLTVDLRYIARTDRQYEK
jgi:hypothetical protein